MTKEEAKKAVELGYRVTHLSFGDGEYIKSGPTPDTLLDWGNRIFRWSFYSGILLDGWSVVAEDTEVYFIEDSRDSERVLKELRRLGASDDHLHCDGQFLYLVDPLTKRIKSYYIGGFVGQLVMRYWKRGVLPEEQETIVIGDNRYFLKDVEERVKPLTPLT